MAKGNILMRGRSAHCGVLVLALVLAAALFVSLFLVSDLTRVRSSADWIETVGSRFYGFSGWLAGNGFTNGMDISLCRLLIVALVGAALSISGAVYQGVFHNPMASPGVLGVQSGGVLAGALYIFWFTEASGAPTFLSHSEAASQLAAQGFVERYAQQLAILLGSVGAVLFIVSLSRAASRLGQMPASSSLLILGAVFSSFISAGVSLLRYYMVQMDPTDSRISSLQVFLMGSFNDANSWGDLLFVGVPIAAGIALLIILRAPIDLLVFSEDEARTAGVPVGVLRVTLIAAATLLTAVTISICGQIGFVGLMVPHLARMLCGPGYRCLLPASALAGATIMLLVYSLASTLGSAIFVNLFASCIGGPLFFILLMRSRRGGAAQWS